FNLTHTYIPTLGQPFKPVLSLTAFVLRGRGGPFDKCRMSGLAPGVWVNIGLPVTPDDITALRNLKLGKTHRMEWKGQRRLSGDCDNDILRPGEKCIFSISGWLTIQHVTRNPYTR